MTGKGIVTFSSIDWSFLWQGPQEIAVRLGAAGNRVLFVENTGVRTPRVSDARRIAHRLRGWASARPGLPRQVAHNVYVMSPLVLPPLGSPWQRRVNRTLLAWQVRQAMRLLDIAPDAIWTYLPTDTVADAIAELRAPNTRVIYYCVGDFPRLASRADRMVQSERSIVAASDVVFANCDAIANRFAQSHANVHVFPFGVNVDAFANDAAALAFRGPIVDRVRALPRPIIGYAGGLHGIVDLKLAVSIARARPNWSWVYAGTIQRDDLAEFAALPNVHLIGQRPHDELPALLQAFDVAIVPYRRAPLTDTVVPTKINEYLAAGKPVVSTDLPTVCAFDERHQVLHTAAADPGLFVLAIEAALATAGDAELVARRRAVSAEADWGMRLREMLALVG